MDPGVQHQPPPSDPEVQLCIFKVGASYQRDWIWSPSLTLGRESLGWHRSWPQRWPSLLVPVAPSSAASVTWGHCYGPGVGTGDVAPGESHAPLAASLPTFLCCACPGLHEESCPINPKSKCCLKSDHRPCSGPIFFRGDEFPSKSNLCPSNCGLSILWPLVFFLSSQPGHSLFTQPHLMSLPFEGYTQGPFEVFDSVPECLKVSQRITSPDSKSELIF